MDRNRAVSLFVSSSPKVLGGEPAFTGTRVPVKNLIDYLEAGDTLDDFLEAFPSVSREQATAAIEAARGDQIRKSKREELRGLAGRARMKVDISRSRERRGR